MDRDQEESPTTTREDVEGGSTRKEVVTTTVLVNLTEDELRRNRTFMTIMHFVLTYPRWSFSLFLLLASGSLPGTLPNFDEAVREPIQTLRTLVNSESEAYHQCTVHAFDAARVRLNETVAEEWERSLAIRERNSLLVQNNITTTVNKCSSATQQSHEALAQWYQQQRLDHVPWINVNGTNELEDGHAVVCSARDRDFLVSGLYGNKEAEVFGLTRQVEDRLSEWHTRTLNTATALSGYAESRAAYDYDYFVGQKVQSVLRKLHDFELDATTITTPSLPEQELLGKIRSVLLGLTDILNDAKSRVGILDARLRDFHLSIQGFRSNYQDLYNRLSLASGFVRDFLPPRVKLPSYLDISSVPVVDQLVPPVFQIPTFDGKLADVNLDRVLDAILFQIRGSVLGVFGEVSQEVQAILDQLLVSIQDALSLEDYNPPQFSGIGSTGSVAEEVQVLDEDGNEIQRDISRVLEDMVQEAPSEQPEVGGQNLSMVFDVQAPEYLGVENGRPTSFAYLEPAFPHFAIPEAILVFLTFALAHQWIIEAVIQFFRIVRLKRKYERDATPDLPEIDLSSDEDEKFSESSGSLVLVALLQHLLTPWMILGLVLLPFAFLGVTMWLPHVKKSCVDTRNGTFVARNMAFPILINEASLLGNAHHTQAEFACQRAQQEACATKFQESGDIFRSDALSKHTLISQFNESIERQETFRRCIALDVLDDLFSEACCGLIGYTHECSGVEAKRASCPINTETIPPSPFPQLGQILNAREICSENTLSHWDLLDNRFDCSVLRNSCATTACPGIDADLMERTTIDIDCEVETYMIKCCVLVLLALYHGIMVNLVSSLAFNGVKHLRWRNLRPDGIKFRTNIAEDGTLVKGDSQDERSRRIQSALRRFELLGEVQFFLSCILFTIWLVSFFLVRYFLHRQFARPD